MGSSVGMSGCSIIVDIVNNSKAKKAEEEAAAAKEAELAKAREELEAMRQGAIDPAATPQQVWDYSLALGEVYDANEQDAMGVDGSWLTELETALTQRLDGAGGLSADNSLLGYSLAQVYLWTERPDEGAGTLLEFAKLGGEGPMTSVELFDSIAGLPPSDVTNAAVLELCPTLRPQIEGVNGFVSTCLDRAGGDISKLSWEGVLADLESYARSGYAKGPAAGTFTYQSKVKGYKKTFWALGFVENTSGVFLENPKVTAVLVDEGGAELGTFQGYAMIDELAPGVRAPVSILVNDPPKYADIRYEFNPEQADYLSDPVDGLRVEALQPRRKRYGWKVEGKVLSEASKPAQFVKVVVSALDADGQLVGATSTYIDEDKLEPGGEARWSTTSMDTARKPVSFEYQVTARVAD
ncbi:hypothetical protein PPSIR1_22259 [Plesiocystis pacifica SIR-1]|uniref:Uncharacterized protein n=2 Tax=Plesiocystis pacifica TaxID=191768 RepID=A6FXU9_9BACT|nr:hypothetical protein PPSIR1_22259 [Plesiocystis pacifica SIR-1]